MINADNGFVQNTDSFTEYGTVASAAETVAVDNLLCGATTTYYDSELLSCTKDGDETLDTS